MYNAWGWRISKMKPGERDGNGWGQSILRFWLRWTSGVLAPKGHFDGERRKTIEKELPVEAIGTRLIDTGEVVGIEHRRWASSSQLTILAVCDRRDIMISNWRCRVVDFCTTNRSSMRQLTYASIELQVMRVLGFALLGFQVGIAHGVVDMRNGA